MSTHRAGANTITVRITNNHIYGNTTGIASDTLSSAGHPGFPADGVQIDNNYIYSNNLDLYTDEQAAEALDYALTARVSAPGTRW